jgi:AraC-like DNA-binding protein
MRVDGVQLMEPGEFHANLWCAPRATFRVVQVAPEVMSELARRSGWTSGGPIHFTKAQLYGGPIRARLKQLTHVLVDEPDLEGADYALHGLLDDLDEHGCLEARRPSASPLKCWNRIRRARELIESKWNKPLTLAEILATSGLTKDTLYRRFREDYGTTPKAYHNHVRLLRAKDMLLRPEASLADTAKQCRLTFTRFLRMFEKEFGVAPLEYMSAVGTLGRSSQIVPVPLERTEHVSSPEPSRARIHPNPADANRNRA